MAKAGKLGKLLKKMQSIGRTSFNREIDHDHHDHDHHHHHDHDHHHHHARGTTSYNDGVSTPCFANNLSPVYVGKSRRRYMVSSEVVDHPLFRELVERSSPESGGGAEDISVNCEVVLFEHLLWMLENADPQTQPESLDELVDFYAY